MPRRGADLYPPGLLPRMEQMLRAGDSEGVLVMMFQELVRMPAEELALMRSQTAAWERRIANARTLPRELETDAAYVFDPARFASVVAPVLLLVGGDSPDREMAHARAVAAALPSGRIAVMPGQQHAAMYTAPDLFVSKVAGFLSE